MLGVQFSHWKCQDPNQQDTGCLLTDVDKDGKAVESHEQVKQAWLVSLDGIYQVYIHPKTFHGLSVQILYLDENYLFTWGCLHQWWNLAAMGGGSYTRFSEALLDTLIALGYPHDKLPPRGTLKKKVMDACINFAIFD